MDLQLWLKHATQALSRESAHQIRREIEDHYQSALKAALDRGATPADADRQAIAALGDPGIANDQYCAVLLTKEEAKMLRGVKQDDQCFHSRPVLVKAFRAGLYLLLSAAAAAYAMGASNLARILFSAALGLGMIFAVPTFHIYTPLRSQVYRYAKWPVVVLAIELAHGFRSFDWPAILILLAIFG